MPRTIGSTPVNHGPLSTTTINVVVTPPDDPNYYAPAFILLDGNGDVVHDWGVLWNGTEFTLKLDTPTTGTYYLFGRSSDINGNVNPIVAGITPFYELDLDSTGGTIDPAQMLTEALSAEFTVKDDGTGNKVFGVSSKGITEDLIDDFAVSAQKIADGAVLTSKIPDLSIATSKLANLAVDSTKLADLAVQAAKLADSSVTATKIANAAVGTAAIATAAVGTAAIQDAAVTNAKIGNLAVSTAKIQDAAVTTAQIANLAVTNALIADAAVTTAKIQDAAITNAKIQDAAITSAKISDLAVSKISGWSGATIEVGSGLMFTVSGSSKAFVSSNGISAPTVTVNGGGHFYVGSTPGLDASITIAGGDGKTHYLTFLGGILTAYSHT
jgi:hypothetical protein